MGKGCGGLSPGLESARTWGGAHQKEARGAWERKVQPGVLVHGVALARLSPTLIQPLMGLFVKWARPYPFSGLR